MAKQKAGWAWWTNRQEEGGRGAAQQARLAGRPDLGGHVAIHVLAGSTVAGRKLYILHATLTLLYIHVGVGKTTYCLYLLRDDKSIHVLFHKLRLRWLVKFKINLT
ncbi:hypothetical protein PVAP13_7KG377301 [Panicum virgatum]|uniref:Uncharacterized protein n=1 Tax=Panicum virgatum TaxID=38727 RepID=A0A8T0QRA2_PANVG|nr:hypothetical protein PVAP13_7KG377301 [Panicum virgatum]